MAMTDVAMLGVIGDHDEGGRTNGGATCQQFILDFAAQGGFAEVIVPRDPPLNIPGNTHMMMMDENSHEIADIIIDWLKLHTDYVD